MSKIYLKVYELTKENVCVKEVCCKLIDFEIV